MQGYQSSNVNCFMAVLFFIVAWWYAPGFGDRYDGNVIAAFFFAACGLGFVIAGARQAVWQPSPFRSPVGRLLWFLRPRGWMVAWAVIVISIWTFGTPHVLYEYPVKGPGTCVYLGWDGFASVRASGSGRLGGCQIMAVM